MEALPRLIDAYRARQRIQTMVDKTPMLAANDLARHTGAASVHFKMESLQPTGAFKIRGAANKILSLDEEARRRGVVTFSTGNHGKAVAYVAGQAGIQATVCLSANVPPYRVEMIRSLGATVAVKGRSQDEAEKHYRELVEERGLIPVVPFDDPLIIAGQGTIALEIVEQLPHVQVLLVQLSGGGLLAGIAMVAKAINPDIQVVGISLERSPAMLESLKAGRPVQVHEKPSIADSLLGGIGFDNHYTLPMVAQYVDEHLLVGEEEIKQAMLYLFETHRIVAEGAAAVGVSALLNTKVDVRDKHVVAIISGGTIETATYLQTIQTQLERKTGQ
jgi:threonine dehydratase